MPGRRALVAPFIALLVSAGCRQILGIDDRALLEGGGGGTTASTTVTGGGGDGGGGASCSLEVFASEPLPGCVNCLREHCCAPIDACAADPGCLACTHAEEGCDFPATYGALKACVREGECADECYPDSGVPLEPGFCAGADLDPVDGACGFVAGQAWCNPLLQSGTCSHAAGLACDFDLREPRPDTATRFTCFPSSKTLHVCSDCGVVEGQCHFRLTCANYKCMKFCCADADCGADRCDTSWVEYRFVGDAPPGLGVCVAR